MNINHLIIVKRSMFCGLWFGVFLKEIYNDTDNDICKKIRRILRNMERINKYKNRNYTFQKIK
jgi:hypothetical protein